MDSDVKTLLLALLVIVAIGAVAFSFGDITGRAARSYEKVLSKISVSSDPDIAEENPVVSQTDFLYITVETGSSGITDSVSFYEITGVSDRRRSTTSLGCTGYICRPNRVVTKDYKIPSGWSGEYCVRVHDKEFDKDVEDCFTVQ